MRDNFIGDVTGKFACYEDKNRIRPDTKRVRVENQLVPNAIV